MSSVRAAIRNGLKRARHPRQPLVKDKYKVVRFKKNAIVEHLLNTHPTMSMNDIARLNVPREDHEQFAQLIGYSLSGFGDLSYASDEVYDAACKEAEKRWRR